MTAAQMLDVSAREQLKLKGARTTSLLALIALLVAQGSIGDSTTRSTTQQTIQQHTSRRINTKVLFRDHVVLYLDSIQPPGSLNRTKVC
jgi:hypothetical protein